MWSPPPRCQISLLARKSTGPPIRLRTVYADISLHVAQYIAVSSRVVVPSHLAGAIFSPRISRDFLFLLLVVPPLALKDACWTVASQSYLW